MTKKENLSQRTADVLRQMIVQKQTYQVGQKLPNENDLSAQLGISRTTLREAIRILVSEGLLYVERGNGTFIYGISFPIACIKPFQTFGNR